MVKHKDKTAQKREATKVGRNDPAPAAAGRNTRNAAEAVVYSSTTNRRETSPFSIDFTSYPVKTDRCFLVCILFFEECKRIFI